MTEEAENKAKKEAEQAIAVAERAIRAVVFPVDSNMAAKETRQIARRDSEGAEKAKATREAAQEAKREAKEAKLASKVAKRAKAAEARAIREAAKQAKIEAKEAKLAAKAAKRAKVLDGKVINRNEIIVGYERERIANVDRGVKQAEVELAKEEVTRETEKAREVELNAEVAAKVKEAKAVKAQLFKGTINLLLLPPVDVPRIKDLEDKLHLIQNLRVILTGGSVDGLARIVVSAEQPIPLLDILRKIPIVDQVTKKDKEIELLLKA